MKRQQQQRHRVLPRSKRPAPPPPEAQGNEGLTPEKEARLLALMAEGWTVTAASREVGISRVTVWKRRRDSPAFAERYQHAEEDGTQALEQEAYRRAVLGTERPLVSNGQVITTVRNYSDLLLIFLLKARRPNVYREHVRVQHTGEDGGLVEYRNLSSEELQRRINALLAKPGLRARIAALVAPGAEPALPAPAVQPPLPGRVGHQPAAGEVLSDDEQGADYRTAK